MRFLKSKKGIALIATLVVAAGASVGAYAYFTDSGAGTGTGTVGTATPFVIAGTNSGDLYPGNFVTESFAVTNNANANQEIGTITLSGVKACDGAGSSWNGTGCSASGTEVTDCESFSGAASDPGGVDFYMAPVVENQDMWIHDTYSATTSPALANPSATLYMDDLNASQNSCENANITFSFTSN